MDNKSNIQMKTILFATDFSRAAAKAANYATQLAQEIDAKVVLLHAVSPMFAYTPDMQTFVYDNEAERQKKERALGRMIKRLTKISRGKVKFETYLKEGFAKDVIVEAIETIKPNFLVMGTIGQLPQASKFIGSLATDMISESGVPMVLVPPKAKFRPFENLVLALDFSKTIDAVIFEKMVSCLKSFKAVVNIISVTKHPEDKKQQETALRVRELLRNEPHTVSVLKSDDFQATLLDFAKKNHADLIVTLPKQHNFIERWFKQSNTEALAFRTDLPLIAIS